SSLFRSLEQENGPDFPKQVVEQPHHHEHDDHEPDDGHPMRHVFLSHLLQHGVDHGDDDADAGDLKDGAHLDVHGPGLPHIIRMTTRAAPSTPRLRHIFSYFRCSSRAAVSSASRWTMARRTCFSWSARSLSPREAPS